MTKAHYVKRARKDNPVAKKGEDYWWWKFRYRGKQFSKTRPRRSQLTQSDFLATIWGLEDGLGDTITEEEAQSLAAELEELRDGCEERLDNMPYQLQDGEAGYLLQERINGLDDWIGAIESLPWDVLTPEEAAAEIENNNPGVW